MNLKPIPKQDKGDNMYIYGRNVAKEYSDDVLEVYISDNFKDHDLINKYQNKIIRLPKYKMDKMVDGNHQGIILKVKDYEYASLDELIEDDSLIVILDHIEDPHNFGAIIRTCEAAKVTGIIIPKDRSVSVNGTVSKVSVGTVRNVKIAMVTNLVNTINELKKQGFWIVGTDMDGTDFRDINYDGKTAIIIGNEAKGMSRLVKEQCDFIASIKMKGTVNSLNASVAAGIVIFEATKGR